MPSQMRVSLADLTSRSKETASGVLTMHGTGGVPAAGESCRQSRNQWWENRTVIDPSENTSRMEFTRFYG